MTERPYLKGFIPDPATGCYNNDPVAFEICKQTYWLKQQTQQPSGDNDTTQTPEVHSEASQQLQEQVQKPTDTEKIPVASESIITAFLIGVTLTIGVCLVVIHIINRRQHRRSQFRRKPKHEINSKKQ